MKIESYCAGCLETTEHETSLDRAGDIVLTCPVDARFWKIPAKNAEGKLQSPDEVAALVALHFEENKNQVPAHGDYA